MKITCISGSNVMHQTGNSISTTVCELAERILHAAQPDLQTQTLRLADYDLRNCVFCGNCMAHEQCQYDSAFNTLYAQFHSSDAFVFVVPFYSVIPSKLTMLMEKLNQIYYTAWLKNPNQKFALAGKKAAVIGHGGSILEHNPRVAAYYRDLLLKPLHYSLQSLGFEVMGAENEKGAIFGVKGYKKEEDSIFPHMMHDLGEIEEIITPLVKKLLE